MTLRPHVATLALLLLTTPGIARERVTQGRTPLLWWNVKVLHASYALEGLTYDFFRPRSDVKFEFTVKNEETDQGIYLPPEFLASVQIEFRKAGTPVPMKLEWKAIRLHHEDISIAPGQSVVLQPDTWVEITAVFRREGGGPFDQVDHRLWVSIANAVRGIRLSDIRTPWKGHFEPEGDVLVRFSPPKTAEDTRRHRMLEGLEALDKEDWTSAFTHFGEILKIDSSDSGGRYGLGLAYSGAGKFREAAREFEVIAAAERGERSMVYYDLAYAYVALGEIQRAEASLRMMFLPERIRGLIQRIQEDLRKRMK